jgi:dihydrofolate reductase
MGMVTADISVTLDGYGAGPNQRLAAPFGDLDADRLHSWQFEHADESAAEVAAITEADAYIMGRNMFSPGRGEWDLAWKGWWGEEPPYHAPVFVLTHHEREPLSTRGPPRSTSPPTGSPSRWSTPAPPPAQATLPSPAVPRRSTSTLPPD